MYNKGYNRYNKIPYDNEPIARGRNTQGGRQSQNNNKRGIGFVDWLQFLICLCLVVAVAFLFRTTIELKGQRAINTYNVDATNSDVAYAAAKGRASTVNVGAVKSAAIDMSNDTNFFRYSYSLGSGVIYSLDKETGRAFIITNYHVVADHQTYPNGYGYYYILLWDSERPVRAKYVGGSYIYDIAVLTIDESTEMARSSCTQVTIADSSDITFANTCIAIGNSMGRNLRATFGIVGFEEVVFSKGGRYVTYLSPTSDVNSGNSGGGLYNAQGNLIGIVDAKFADVRSDGTLEFGEVVHGMYYAIPSNTAISVARNIIRNSGTLKMANIGLVLGEDYLWGNPHSGGEGGAQTCYDLEVIRDSFSFHSGDILKSLSYTFGGRVYNVDLNHISALEDHIFNLGVGDEITIKVSRLGINKNINITVGSLVNVA